MPLSPAHHPFASSRLPFRIRSGALACLVAAGLVSALPANASSVSDAPNDFIASFLGAHSPDLDVLSAFATFDGTTFQIGGTVNAPVGTLPSALYVFGFNRGAGNTNFAAIGHAGVVFDAVITMTGAGVLGGRDLVSNTPIAVPGTGHISGSSFSIDVPASLLPSQGLSFAQYAVNLWPRDASVAAGATQISDFAPDNADFTVSTVEAIPEPGTQALFVLGLAGMAGVLRRRRGAAARTG